MDKENKKTKFLVIGYILSAIALIGMVVTIVISGIDKNTIRMEPGQSWTVNVRFPLSVMANKEICTKGTPVECSYEWHNDGHADITISPQKEGTYDLVFVTELPKDSKSYKLIVE